MTSSSPEVRRPYLALDIDENIERLEAQTPPDADPS